MKYRFLIPVLILVLSVIGSAQKLSKALEAYNQGLEFQDRGDVANALRLYDQAIELDPRLLDAYNNRANLKIAAGDLVGAIADFSKAIEIEPKQGLSYYNRGNIYLEQGEYDSAIKDFSSAITIYDGLTNAYDKRAHAMSFNNRGNALLAKGESKLALNDFNRAINILPKSFEALTGSGAAKFQLGDKAGAVADYSAALAIFPKNPVILMNRAGALEDLDPHASIRDYNLVIELEPANALAYARRGLTFLEVGRKSDAITDLRKAIGLNPALKEEFEPFLQRALR